MARRGSLAQPVPYEPPGRQSPPAPPGEELKAQPGGPARAQLPCTMPKASSALLLAGLLVLWAELLPASGPNVTSEYERTAPRQQPASLLARGLLGMGSRHTFRSVAVLCSIPEPTPGLGTASPPPDGPPTHTVCLCLSVKAGVCPEPAAEEANCTMGCQSDGDCESTLKCCPAACGKACQEPNGNAPRVGASPAPVSRWLRGSRRSVAVWSWASPVLWLQHSRGALHGTPQDWAVLPWSSCPHSLGWCWPHSPLPPACSSVGSEHPWCC